MTEPEPPFVSRHSGLLGVLDRYIEVDRLRLSRGDVKSSLPRLRPWEWVWYVAANIVFAVAFDWLNDHLYAWAETVPYLRHLPQLLTWPALGLLFSVAAFALLPARQARRAAKGEAFLSAAIWLAVWGVRAVTGW